MATEREEQLARLKVALEARSRAPGRRGYAALSLLHYLSSGSGWLDTRVIESLAALLEPETARELRPRDPLPPSLTRG